MKKWGGATRLVGEVASRLAKKAEVELLVGSCSSLAQEKLVDKGVPFRIYHSLGSDSWKYWSFLPYYTHRNRNDLSSELRNADVVITSYLTANLVANEISEKVVYYCFEPFSLFYNEAAIGDLRPELRLAWRILGSLYRAYDSKAVRKTARILTIDNYTQEFIKRLYARSSTIIQTGVDTDFFRRIPYSSIREKYAGQHVILNMTHGYSYPDGCDFLVRSLPYVLKHIENCKVLIASLWPDPSNERRLIELARRMGVLQNVEILGFIDEGLLPAYYSAADVLAQPSLGNTQMSIKEAMACETPVVTFAGGVAEDIEGVGAGIAVPRSDVLELAKALVRILENPELAAEMGVAGRKKAVTLYRWDVVAKTVWRAIEDLVT